MRKKPPSPSPRSVALRRRFAEDEDFRRRHADGVRAHHRNHPVTEATRVNIAEGLRWYHHDRTRRLTKRQPIVGKRPRGKEVDHATV